LITIVDYGRGNLRSVEKAFEYLGHQVKVSSDPGAVAEADALVLPGVGAFDDAIISLKEKGLDEAIRDFIRQDRPYLGICLGYQLLFESSEEGKERGLDILPGRVRRLPGKGLKVPHMGWNSIEIAAESPLLQGIRNGSYCYFVHSYFVEPEDDSLVLTWTEYGVRFASGVHRGKLAAFQFHPEKSSRTGLAILANFATMVGG